MNHIFENMYANRELHSVLFGAVCEKYDLTLSEMLVLIFLDKNRNSDTATEMVDKLKLAKSHVSASVRDLEARGYIKGSYGEKDRRTIHLRLCDKSTEIIRAGEHIQEEFLSVLCHGFSEQELGTLKNYMQRMTGNVNEYLCKNGYGKGGVCNESQGSDRAVK